MQRVKELDSIRGLASLAIVVYHLWFTRIGLLGAAVDLFFVLSGFLITSILLNNSIDHRFLVSFYARRVLRIWPIYYLSLLTLVLVNPFTAEPGSLDGLPCFATFTQNISYYWSDSAPAFIPAFRHSWSVAIEEQFYLFWPALLWLVGRRGVPFVTVGLIGLAVTTRALQFNRWILATHCDGLALGSLLALWFISPARVASNRGNRSALLPLGLGAAGFWLGGPLALQFIPSAWQPGLQSTVQSLRFLSLNLAFFALVGMIVRHAGDPWLAVLRHRWLVYLGQISYGLYLYHHIIFTLWDDVAIRWGLQSHLGCDLAKATVSLAVAALSWRFVERPILSLKDRFRYQACTIDRRHHSHLPEPVVLKGAISITEPRSEAKDSFLSPASVA